MEQLSNFKEMLGQFVALRSISTDPAFKEEINKTVEWLHQLFEKNGFGVEYLPVKRVNPIILASLVVDESYPTLLVYGHYDVQPASIEDGWDSDPFQLRDGGDRWYARGIVDNKGQILTHIFTVLQLKDEGKLKFNVKFMIEGNEETANEEMTEIMKSNLEKIKADHVLVSDGEILGDTPFIEVSLRGGLNLTLRYTTAKNNVHSGIYGGAIPNAPQELAMFISKLYSANSVSYPQFYQNADQITDTQRENNLKLSKFAQDMVAHIDTTLLTESGNDFFTQTGLRPTIQVTGFKAGYIGDGYANIVPSTAEVRLNFRIVTSQKPDQVLEQFEKFVEENTPEYVKYEITTSGLHNPVKLDDSSEMMQQTKHYLSQAYDKDVPVKNVGGAIPFVSDVKEFMGVDTLLVSLGNDDCNMHGPNENFKVDLIEKGLRFSRMFFSRE